MKNEQKNSVEYLNNITGKKTGFSVPTNYFNAVEDAFSTNLFEDSNSKKNAFKTPASYFDNLETEILTKVYQPKKETKVITLKDKLLKFIPYAAAASVLLFVGLHYFSADITSDKLFDDLADNEIENWLLENSSEISNQDFAMVISEDVLTDFTFSEIEDDDIEDYIISTQNTSILNDI